MAGAKHYHEQALHIYRELGNRRGESQALVNLGYFFYGLGDYDQARAYCEQARQVHRELGNRQGECYALNNLGLACACQGDYAQAKAYLEQSLDIGRAIDEPRIVGYILSNLGNALAGLGLLTEAADACRQALVLWRELNQPNLATEPLAGLARIALAQGDLSRAQAHVEEILGHLESGTLHGTEEPARIYMTCYHILRANQDPRAPGILITAHHLLQEQAATIGNEEMRRSFLENVPTHREILSEFSQRDQ
jgi:tetratricopeptide (TPR) repeat protein